ncbi:MAG: alpha/beta hydrolase, partial [Saprospiraceae bacterium]
MKSIYTLLLLCVLVATQSFAQDNRYLAEVFTEVDVQEGVVYANNVTVLTVSDPNIGKPVPRDLLLDIYTPVGDMETERPLVLYFPTGNFLPNPINGGTTGTMKDPVLVDISTRLAKMGYVVAVVDYRKGWNPISDDPLERRSTLINAAYRGIQDSRTAVRFFKKTVAEEGNPYGICGDRITLWGQGTGGYITLGSNAINSYNELLLPKFFGADINGDGNPDPMVIEPIHGNPDGTLATTNPANGEPLSIANHAEYDSEFQLTVNIGGALGDISWLTEEDGPIISYHVPRDPFAPYGTAELIVPTTGEFVVEVSGSFDVQAKAAEFNLNESFTSAGISDDFTAAADARNDGNKGLYPMPRPDGVNPLTGQPALEG